MDHIFQTIGSPQAPDPQVMQYAQFYREQVNRIPDGGRFVEVGVYYGRSFSYFIVEMINAGKRIDCVAVDACPWDGEPCTGFHRHMEPLKDYFRVMFERVDSFVAAQNFEDGSIDLGFLDANHTYPFISKDIAAYLPKVKKGGILSGHDIDDPDVLRAVREVFGDNFVHDVEQNIWWTEV